MDETQDGFGDFDDDDADDDRADLDLIDIDAVRALQAEYDAVNNADPAHQKQLAKDLVRRMNGAE